SARSSSGLHALRQLLRDQGIQADPGALRLDGKCAMHAPVDAHLKDTVVLSPRRRGRNLQTAGRVRFFGRRPSYVELLERPLRSWTERRDRWEFNQVGKPVVILVEEQLNRISVETIPLSLLSHWIPCRTLRG